jgi:uncharacterized membrane protein (UPF0127 family)
VRPLPAALLATAMVACRPPPGPTPTPAARALVVVDSPSGRSTAVEAEVARRPEELERGLMFREALRPGAGMLFVFPETAEHVFWMKNTAIPLDMLFVDEGGAVVAVVERAEPFTTSPRTAGTPCRYVLEVPGGFAAERGIRPGDRVRIEWRDGRP